MSISGHNWYLNLVAGAYRFNYFPLVVTRGDLKKIDGYLKVSGSSVQFDMCAPFPWEE